MRAVVAGCRDIAPTGLTALRMLGRKKEGKKKRKRDKEEQRGGVQTPVRGRHWLPGLALRFGFWDRV